MTKKELLVYEMESLMKTLIKYLNELDADMYTLSVALRVYFGCKPTDNHT